MTAASVPLLALAPHERPRERLLALGPGALTEAELVAVLLGSGRVGESALTLAQSLLVEFGGVYDLSRAHPEQLATRSGVGAAKAARLAAAFELAGRMPGAPEGSVLRTSADIASVVTPLLARATHERVAVVVCDGQNRVRRVSVVSEGGIDATPLPVREVLALVLRHDGRSFALAHNHPGGSAAPSDHDREATARMRAAAEAVGLRFLDHVVVAGVDWASVTPAS